MRLNTLSIIREQPTQAKVLFFTVFLFRCSTIAFPFYGAYLIAQNIVSIADAAVVIGTFGVGALTADLILTVALPYVRADLVIKSAIAALACLMFGINAVSSFLSLLGLTFLWGVCYEAVTPASYAMIADIYQGQSNKMAFACNRLAINMGMAIGPLLGGLLYAFRPPSIFLGNALGFIVTGLFVIRFMSRNDNLYPEAKDSEITGEKISVQKGENTRFWFAFFITLPLHVAFALPPTMIGVLVLDNLRASAVWVSTIFIINTLMVIVLEVPLNKKLDNRTVSTVLILSFVISGIGFILMGISSRLFFLLGATALWTFGEMTIFPTFLAYIDKISSRRLVKRNMGLYSAGVNVGVLFAPPFALAITRISGGLPWVLAGGCLITSAGILLLTRNLQSLWLDGFHVVASENTQSVNSPARI